jgi:tRNA (Thr-GGU) A37 N-methylase
METIAKLTARATRSRRVHGAEPVVETVDQAIALAQAIARGLDGLQGEARLLMLSNLDDVRQALDARTARLEKDLAVEGERLRAVHRGLRAVGGYAPPRQRR